VSKITRCRKQIQEDRGSEEELEGETKQERGRQAGIARAKLSLAKGWNVEESKSL
jgi:hypothetical protein